MMRRSNRMIMFAVIAAIIVAVPISLYGLSQKSVPIIATDGEAYANYSMNCTISTTPPMCLGTQVAQANISENSSRTSSFALGASGYLFYVGNSHAGAYHISLNLNLTGIFYSYLNPKNLTLSYIGSGTGNELCAFFGTLHNYWYSYAGKEETTNCTNLTTKGGLVFELTSAGHERINLELVNRAANSNPYHFSLSTQLDIVLGLYPGGYHSATLSVIMLEGGKLVSSTVELTFYQVVD